MNWFQKTCRIGAIKPRQVVQVLNQHGFELESRRGNHYKFSKPGHPCKPNVPIHTNRPIPRGTLQQILNCAGISVMEFAY